MRFFCSKTVSELSLSFLGFVITKVNTTTIKFSVYLSMSRSHDHDS